MSIRGTPHSSAAWTASGTSSEVMIAEARKSRRANAISLWVEPGFSGATRQYVISARNSAAVSGPFLSAMATVSWALSPPWLRIWWVRPTKARSSA